MVIQNELDIELWETIKKNYESENFTGAILDSIFKLTDIIRNKTGLEGDGASLIGQAFGGDNPKIKLNKLQTDSEKDVQRGIQEILRGIYTAIRNPRSHDGVNDEKSTADAIIIFINYILCLIDKSKLSFDEEIFMKRIFDPYYVKSVTYSNLLIQDIPKRQRASIAITTILRRNEGDIKSLGHFIPALFVKLNDAELSRVYKVISDELRTTTRVEDIRYLVHICPGEYWPKIEEAARLRTEAILYEDFSNASYDIESRKCGCQGAIATWITREHLENFCDLDKWTRKTINMIENGTEGSKYYAESFMWSKICYANKENITWTLQNFFKKALEDGNQEIIKKLELQIIYDENHPWWKVFEKELKEYPDIELAEFPF